MANIRTVATDAEVSIATVSRVVNNQPGVSDEVRRRVLESIKRCGYVSTVGRRNTSYVGLAYTGPMSLGSPYDAAIVAGMVATLDKSDLDLVFLNLQRDKKLTESYMQFFHRKGIRGVILRTTNRTRDVCEAIVDEGFPCVVVGDRFDRDDMNYVHCDSTAASYQGMEHLITLGHRRIALAISDLVKDSDHEDRLKAYEQALEDHEISLDRKLYFHIPPSHPDGAQVVRRMLSMTEPPTAIFFTDPLVAVGAINEAHKLGIGIPDDLSVLGFDDTEVRHHVSPTMTSICQDARRLGIESITILSQILEPKYDGTPVIEDLSTWLEINGTTGPPSRTPIQLLPDGSRGKGDPA